MFSQTFVQHRVDRLRISLDMLPQHAEELTEEVSRLFKVNITPLMSQVLDDVERWHGPLLVPEILNLDLGELPLIGFGAAFCKQFEDKFFELLLGYGSMETSNPATATAPDVGDQARDALERFSSFLDNGNWSASDSTPFALDDWLLRQLARHPRPWLVSLAGQALRPSSLRKLYSALRPATYLRLCHYLAPLVPIPLPLGMETLLLCALRYFQQHPSNAVPMPPPNGVISLSDRDGAILAMLFNPDKTMSAALISWRNALWRQPSAQAALAHYLTPSVFDSLRDSVEAMISNTPVRMDLTQHPAATEGPLDMMTAMPSRPCIENTCNESELAVSVSNGGVTLLWPLLPNLFNQLGLMNSNRFTDYQAQVTAVYCLDELVWADGEHPMRRMQLNKVLCGLPLDVPLPDLALDEAHMALVGSWLAVLVDRLGPLARLGDQDLRHLFLQRQAWLTPSNNSPTIYIQPEPYDVLLTDWPWPISILQLPWLAGAMTIQWCKPPLLQ